MTTSSSSNTSVSNEVYSGLGTFGIIVSDIRLVIGSILAIVFIIIGIVLIFSKKIVRKTVDAIVTSVNCVNSNNNECNIGVTYTIDGVKYNSSLNSNNQNINSTITVYYDVNNPNDISTSDESSKLMGGLFIAGGIFLFVIVYLVYYFAHKSKTFAAVSGGLDILGMVR